jgi:enolase
MSKISSITFHQVDQNTLKAELLLDTQKKYSTYTKSDYPEANPTKAINVVNRLLNPHFKNLQLKHIKHLDNMLSTLVELEISHLGSFNITFPISELLWQAFSTESQTDIDQLFEPLISGTITHKHPSYIFPLNPNFESIENKYSQYQIITRRNTEYHAAISIYKKIQTKLSSLTFVSNVDCLEAIQNIISQEGYIYNHDVFVGIKPELVKNYHSLEFQIPDSINQYDQNSIFDYFKKIIDIYQPLILENPIFEYQSEIYEQLESELSKETLIALSSNLKHLSEAALKKIIRNKSVSLIFLDTQHLRTISELVSLSTDCHEHGLKFAISHRQVDNQFLNHIIKLLNPEFLEIYPKNI